MRQRVSRKVIRLTFLVQLVIFGAITGSSAAVAWRVAKLARRRFNTRKWAIGAGIFALAAALVGWSSRSLTNACLSERNDGCIDFGGAGTQFLLLLGYVTWALGSAYFMWNE